MDYQGIALVIGAIAGLVTVVGGFLLQVLTFWRQGKMMEQDLARDVIAKQTHDLVNGLSARKDEAQKSAAFAEGKAAGVTQERGAH